MPSFLTTVRPPATSLLRCALVLCVSSVSLGGCQTTAPPPAPCSVYNSCDACVPHRECLWCFATKNCTKYPVSWLLPPASQCPLSQARWSVCWITLEALVILLGVLAGSILIGITACCCWCCCCCCRKARHARPDRDEERFNRKREEMRQRSEERKLERKEKQDEIRRKYGLMGDKDHPYSKFENE